jgi:hypothetical protein
VTGGDELTAWLVMEKNDVLKVEGSSMENQDILGSHMEGISLSGLRDIDHGMAQILFTKWLEDTQLAVWEECT